MRVSRVALVMNKKGNLIVYKNRDRLTNEEVESIRMNSGLQKELSKLKRKMTYNDGTKILLALFVASNHMI